MKKRTHKGVKQLASLSPWLAKKHIQFGLAAKHWDACMGADFLKNWMREWRKLPKEEIAAVWKEILPPKRIERELSRQVHILMVGLLMAAMRCIDEKNGSWLRAYADAIESPEFKEIPDADKARCFILNRGFSDDGKQTLKCTRNALLEMIERDLDVYLDPSQLTRICREIQFKLSG